MSSPQRPSDALRARLLMAAAREPGTAPGSWTRRVVGFGSLAVGWVLAMTALLGVRQDWRQLPPGAVAQTLLALAVVSLAASAGGVSRGRVMVGLGSEWLLALVAGLPLVLLMVVSTIDPRVPDPSAVISRPGDVVARAIMCDLLVLVVAAPLLACCWAMVRGLTLARPGLSGACAGLAAATWAHAVVRIHCPVGGAAHAILGHLLPALPLMAICAWLFSRAQRR